MIRTLFAIAVLIQLPGCASFPVGNDGVALRKSLPIQIYMGTCVDGRSGPDAVESRALEIGFLPASDGVAQQYLGGNPGKAWHLEYDQGEFGLAVLSNSLCSVFIHQGDPATLQKSMEAWLPPEGSGFSYTKESISNTEYLSTTLYQLFRSGQLMERWVITINTQPGAGLVAIMSYDRPH